MTINQATNRSFRHTRHINFLRVVDRAALTVLFTIVMAGLPLTAVNLLTQTV